MCWWIIDDIQLGGGCLDLAKKGQIWGIWENSSLVKNHYLCQVTEPKHAALTLNEGSGCHKLKCGLRDKVKTFIMVVNICQVSCLQFAAGPDLCWAGNAHVRIGTKTWQRSFMRSLGLNCLNIFHVSLLSQMWHQNSFNLSVYQKTWIKCSVCLQHQTHSQWQNFKTDFFQNTI